MKRRLSLDSPPQIKKQKRSPKTKPSPTFSDQELDDLTRLIEEDFSDKELEEDAVVPAFVLRLRTRIET
jgi:hypothetical protein